MIETFLLFCKGLCRFTWKNDILIRSGLHTWPEMPINMGDVSVLVSCQHDFDEQNNGHFHVWLWMPLDVEAAAKFECKISLFKGVTYRGPVFSMVWDRQRVLQEKHMSIDDHTIKMITKQRDTDNTTNKYPIEVKFKVFTKK